ncbi:MAG: ankyrin repeat domain-containing protein [Candidatus Babeliales bacterium]
MLKHVSVFIISLAAFLPNTFYAMDPIEIATPVPQPTLQRTQSLPNRKLQHMPSVLDLHQYELDEGNEQQRQAHAVTVARQTQERLNRMFHDAVGLATGEKPLGVHDERHVSKQFARARELLARGADSKWGYPLAHFLVACKLQEEGHCCEVSLDRDFGVPVRVTNYSTRKVQNPMLYGQAHEFLAWLVDNGADVNQAWPQDRVDGFTHVDARGDECKSNVVAKATGIVPLAYALQLCREGCCVQKLLDAGAQPYKGALYYAFHSANPSAALLLLEAGAAIDELDNQGNGAAHWALALHSPKLRLAALKALQERGASFSVPNKARHTPLHMAVFGELVNENGHTYWRDILKDDASCLAFLLEHEPALNAKGAQGVTALYAAVDMPSVFYAENLASISHSLARFQNDVPAGQALAQLWKDKKSYDFFAQNNAMVALLLAAKADTSIAQKDGFTPIHRAAQRGMAECVRLLIAAEALVDAQDKEFLTALHHVAVAKIPYAEKAQIIKYLTEAGASTEAIDKEGNTALIRAAIAGDVDGVSLLLGFGARVDARNYSMFTAAEMVRSKECGYKRYEDILKLLADYAQGKRKPHSRDGKPFVDIAEGATSPEQVGDTLGNNEWPVEEQRAAELQLLTRALARMEREKVAAHMPTPEEKALRDAEIHALRQAKKIIEGEKATSTAFPSVRV